MQKRELSVQLRNIKEQYPLPLILHETLSVNTRDMTMIKNNHERPGAIKVRQTARKSTRSKLKLNESFLATMSPCTEKSVVETKKSKLGDAILPKKTTATSTCHRAGDNIYTTCSKILPDNKLKIITKKKPGSSSVQVIANDEGKSKKTTTSLLSDTDKDSSNSMKTNIPASTTPKLSGDKPSQAPSNTTSSKETEPVSSPKKDTQPPIKMIVSTVNGHASIQNVTATLVNNKQKENSSTTGSITSGNDSGTKKTGEDLVQKECNSTSTNSQKVSPLKIINNGKPEVKTVAVKKKKCGLEKVVQNLNQKQKQATKEDPVEAFSSGTKRHLKEDPNETVCKKAKNDIHGDLEIGDNPVQNGVETEQKPTKIEVDNKANVNTNNKTFNLAELPPEVKKYVEEAVKGEVVLRMKLKKKCDEYNKLKEKCEGVERNFQSWIEFANKLQAKVKKIAYALHKQQDAVKAIQSHNSIQKHTVAIQTDILTQPVSTMTPVNHTFSTKQIIDSQKALADSLFESKNSTRQKLVSKSLTPTAITQVTKVFPKAPQDIIDLTEECETSNHQQENGKTKTEVQEAVKRNLPSQLPPHNKFISNTGAVGGYPPNAYVSSNAFTSKSRSMAYQQPIASTRTVHSNNTGYRMSQQQTTLMRQPLVQPRSMNSLSSLSSNYMQNSTSQGMASVQKISTTVNRKNTFCPPLPQTTYDTSQRIPSGAFGPPPELTLGIKKSNGGIVLSWSNCNPSVLHADVIGYELYAYQENTNSEKRDWRKIGDDCIAAMDLPMACTLTQFTTGCTYYFTVRGKDIYRRFGPFSKPCSSKDLT